MGQWDKHLQQYRDLIWNFHNWSPFRLGRVCFELQSAMPMKRALSTLSDDVAGHDDVQPPKLQPQQVAGFQSLLGNINASSISFVRPRVAAKKKISTVTSWAFYFVSFSARFERLFTQAGDLLLSSEMTCPPFGFVGPSMGQVAKGGSDMVLSLYVPHWGHSVPDCGPLNMRLDSCPYFEFLIFCSRQHFWTYGSDDSACCCAASVVCPGANHVQEGTRGFQDWTFADSPNHQECFRVNKFLGETLVCSVICFLQQCFQLSIAALIVWKFSLSWGCFGATHKATTTHLSVRGCQVCLARPKVCLWVWRGRLILLPGHSNSDLPLGLFQASLQEQRGKAWKVPTAHSGWISVRTRWQCYDPAHAFSFWL